MQFNKLKVMLFVSLIFFPFYVHGQETDIKCKTDDCDCLLQNAQRSIEKLQKNKNTDGLQQLKVTLKKCEKNRHMTLCIDTLISQIDGFLLDNTFKRKPPQASKPKQRQTTKEKPLQTKNRPKTQGEKLQPKISEDINLSNIKKMKCETCREILETFFSTPLDEGDKNKNTEVFQWSLTYLWQNLYRLSTNDCWEDPNTQETIRKLLFPHMLSPENLLKSIMYMETEDRQKFISDVEMLPDEKLNKLIKFFNELVTKTGKDEMWLDFFIEIMQTKTSESLVQIQNLLKAFNEIESEEERNLLIGNLKRLRFQEIDSLIKESERISQQMKDRPDHIRKDIFMVMDGCANLPDINRIFLEAIEREYGERPRRIDGGRFSEKYYQVKVGDSILDNDLLQNPIEQDNNYLYRIVGGLMCHNDKIVIHLRFLSKTNRVIFADNIEVHRDISEERINCILQNELKAFHSFVYSLEGLKFIPTIDFKKVEEYFNRGVYVDAVIFSPLENKELKRLKAIVIEGDEFWKDENGKTDIKATTIFKNDIKALIIETVCDQNYNYPNLQALLKENPGSSAKDNMVVNAQYSEDTDKGFGYFTINYFLFDRNKPYSTQTIHFAELPTERSINSTERIARIDKLKKNLVSTIIHTLESFLNDRTDAEKAMIEYILSQRDNIRLPLDRNYEYYMKSFLMPGYVNAYYERPPKWYITYWNWSNYAILGLSLSSEMLYVYNVEQEGFHNAARIGCGLFLLNGLCGMYEAYQYKPPNTGKENNFSFNIGGQSDKPMLFLSLKF